MRSRIDSDGYCYSAERLTKSVVKIVLTEEAVPFREQAG